MPETKRLLKVFLCHTAADKPKVRELYRYLRRRGINPWLDEIDLMGGQDWQVEIPKALSISDAIIICLTKNSIDKEGYIQREIKFALDKALEIPEGRIFLIPVRFEDCEVPFSLRRYQWVDLFDKNGFPRLMRALKTRAADLEREAVQVPTPEEPNPDLSSSGNTRKSAQKWDTRIVVTIGVVATILAGVLAFPLLETWLLPAPGATMTVTTISTPPSIASEPASPTPETTVSPIAFSDPHLDASDHIDSAGIPMRLVSAGEFTMGSEDGDSDEAPVHKVILDDFYIDKYEVTNAFYKACVDTGACRPPQGTSSLYDFYGLPEYDNYPVMSISWDMARTYCEWRGAHLPTEAQWEKAARGTDERTYPWGEEIDQTFAHYDQSAGTPSAVGTYETGKSPYGAYDMAGNVWEWVADWYSRNFYANSPASNPSGPGSGQSRVLRGGTWYYGKERIRTTSRDAYDPNEVLDSFGFRCAGLAHEIADSAPTSESASDQQAQISVEQNFPAPGNGAEGITWDGNDLWLTDNSGAIFKVDTSGIVLDSFRSPEVTPQGLTWDGSSFWVYTTNFSFIYQLQVAGENMQTVNSFRSPAEILGGGITQDMAWDGENLWYANQFKVYKLDVSGNVLSSFTFPQNVTGLDWDGSSLWIAYNDFPENASLNRVNTDGEILETSTSPVLEINGLAWADDSLWALGLNAIGGDPMIYKLNIASN